MLFVSLHADPRGEYPYFLGYADERGSGTGRRRHAQLPAAPRHGVGRLRRGARRRLRSVAELAPDAVVVSLGVDTYEHDPISQFRLTRDDFPRLGARIAALGRPTLFVMEGGYAVDDLGINAVAVLTGFESG